MVVIRTGRVDIPSGTGSRTGVEMVWFPDQVIRECWVGLAGYSVNYSSGDHEVQTIEVALSCSRQNTEFGLGVGVAATLLLRDQNGDDSFSGWVDYVLFVELDTRPFIDPAVLGLRVEIQ